MPRTQHEHKFGFEPVPHRCEIKNITRLSMALSMATKYGREPVNQVTTLSKAWKQHPCYLPRKSLRQSMPMWNLTIGSSRTD